jgi:hypothetical protein
MSENEIDELEEFEIENMNEKLLLKNANEVLKHYNFGADTVMGLEDEECELDDFDPTNNTLTKIFYGWYEKTSADKTAEIEFVLTFNPLTWKVIEADAIVDGESGYGYRNDPKYLAEKEAMKNRK